MVDGDVRGQVGKAVAAGSGRAGEVFEDLDGRGRRKPAIGAGGIRLGHAVLVGHRWRNAPPRIEVAIEVGFDGSADIARGRTPAAADMVVSRCCGEPGDMGIDGDVARCRCRWRESSAVADR